MGCISPSSLPAPIPQTRGFSSLKVQELTQSKERFTLISSTQNEPSQSQRQKTRPKVNKVDFMNQSQPLEPTQNIIMSTSEFTVQDKELLDEVLTKNYIFHKLSSQQRKELVDKFSIYDSMFPDCLKQSKSEASGNEKDPYLFRKCDIGTMFFVIKQGNVEIELDNANDQNQQGSTRKLIYGKGESFGQLALFYKTLRSASVKCLGKCTFLCLSAKKFREVLQSIVEKTIQSNKILIERIKLFQYLTPKQKNKLANNIVMLKYEKGDIVFREGQESMAFFIIVSGRVEIEVKNKPLLELKTGDHFGQSCFQQNAKRSGTVQCMQKTQLLSISRNSIKKILGQQTQQFYYFSILKWSLKRNPIFSQMTSKSIQKLLKQCDIISFADGHEILKENEKVRKIYIAIEGAINEFEIGEIVNVEFLGDIQKDKKKLVINETPLIKKKQGYVCVMDINKVLSLLQKHSIIIANMNSKSYEEMKRSISSKKEIQQAHAKTLKQIRENHSFIKLQNLTMVKKIGNGQFGSIYKVRHTLDDSIYALKTFKKSDVDSYKMRHFVKQEVEVMRMIGQHNFIVEYQKHFHVDEFVLILMELIDGKDFFDTILEIGWLSSEQIQFFFATFVSALEFLHDNDIIYRDIKPENAVMEPSGYLKLIDMGTARKLHPATGYRSFTIIGTPHYMAPEVIAGKGYSFQADIWSMGILLYELACGSFPFGQKLEQPIQIYNQIIKPNLSLTYPKEFTDLSLKRLIERLLVKDPSIRQIQNFTEIKENEFYQSFDWEKFESKSMKPLFKPANKYSGMQSLGNNNKKFTEQTLTNFLQKQKFKSKKENVFNTKTAFSNWQDF